MEDAEGSGGGGIPASLAGSSFFNMGGSGMKEGGRGEEDITNVVGHGASPGKGSKKD